MLAQWILCCQLLWFVAVKSGSRIQNRLYSQFHFSDVFRVAIPQLSPQSEAFPQRTLVSGPCVSILIGRVLVDTCPCLMNFSIQLKNYRSLHTSVIKKNYNFSLKAACIQHHTEVRENNGNFLFIQWICFWECQQRTSRKAVSLRVTWTLTGVTCVS